MNLVVLSGNVGRDPESRSFDNGTVRVSFSLAESVRRGGEAKTQWHNCIAFGKTAEVIAQHVRKGSKLLVEGRLQYRSYEHEGQQRQVTEIVVNNVEFVGPKPDGGSGRQQYDGGRDEGGNDDLPF